MTEQFPVQAAMTEQLLLQAVMADHLDIDHSFNFGQLYFLILLRKLENAKRGKQMQRNVTN